jgi:hypothetical protein
MQVQIRQSRNGEAAAILAPPRGNDEGEMLLPRKVCRCPVNGRSFHASFTKAGDRWKMAYFVEGD